VSEQIAGQLAQPQDMRVEELEREVAAYRTVLKTMGTNLGWPLFARAVDVQVAEILKEKEHG
jgi:hypothetical protein